MKNIFKKKEIVAISDYFDESLILFLDAQGRDEALSLLVDALEKAGKLKDRDDFQRAIMEREKLVSTGVGLGVAIPHAKLHGYKDFFIAIGIQHKNGLEWNSLDGAPVRVIFMIGGPENKQTEYLKILSHLTMAIKNEERRKKLLKATTSRDIIDLFSGC